jgi:hypothetical protein
MGGDVKVPIGVADLGRLGRWAKKQRKKEKLQYIYVLGQNPDWLRPEQDEEQKREAPAT